MNPLTRGAPFFSLNPQHQFLPSHKTPKLYNKAYPHNLGPNSFVRASKRCFKCQGFRHLALDCTDRRFITLAEWKAVEEVELEEENEENVGDDWEETLEEIIMKAN